MAVYPINLELSGRRVAVVGGGAVAERKIIDLLTAGAVVSVFSPVLTLALMRLVDGKKLIHIPRIYQPGDIRIFFIVICATDDKNINEEIAVEAHLQGALVNVVDNPSLCDFTVPSKISRGDLLITISTGGQSPALAKKLRLELEGRYGPEYGVLLQLIGKMRNEMKQTLAVSKDRESFWQQAIDEEVLALLQNGKLNEAEEKIKHAIGCIGPQS